MKFLITSIKQFNIASNYDVIDGYETADVGDVTRLLGAQ